jgi:hypothetical protein
LRLYLFYTSVEFVKLVEILRKPIEIKCKKFYYRYRQLLKFSERMANSTSISSPDVLVCATSDLESRFNISKSTRTKRLNQLGFLPEVLHKDGKKYWLTQQQLDIFANFDEYITNNGSEDGYHLLHGNPSDEAEARMDEDASLADDSPIPHSGRYANDTNETAAASGELALQEQASPDMAYTTLTGEFASTSFATADPRDLLRQQVIANAHHQAAGIMIAERTLVNQLLENPQSLDPQLLAQVNAVSIPSVCPKDFAAKLISGGQRII